MVLNTGEEYDCTVRASYAWSLRGHNSSDKDYWFDRQGLCEGDGAKRRRMTSANDKRVKITSEVLMSLQDYIDEKHKRDVCVFLDEYRNFCRRKLRGRGSP